MASETHTVGSKVWVRDNTESWIKGEVLRVEDGGALLVVKTEHGNVQSKPEDLPLQNPDVQGVEVSKRWQTSFEKVLFYIHTKYRECSSELFRTTLSSAVRT